MISRIAVVLALAVVFYFLLPEVSASLQRRLAARRFSKLKQEALSSGTNAIVSGVSGENLLVKPSASGSFMPVSSANTVFFSVAENEIRKIPKRHLLSVPKGISAFYIPPAPLANPLKSRASFIEKRLLSLFVRRKGACFLFDGADCAFPADLSAASPAKQKNCLKPWFVALGAFAEFSLFLAFSGERELFPAAITALVAVFGKGMPYVPPGFFLTMAGTALAAKKGAAKPAVFAVKALGVILNAALFFAIAALLYR